MDIQRRGLSLAVVVVMIGAVIVLWAVLRAMDRDMGLGTSLIVSVILILVLGTAVNAFRSR